MVKSKTRDSLFLVVRQLWSPIADDSVGYAKDAHVVGAYRTYDRADEICGAYKQQVIDGKIPNDFTFEVQIATYYDE